MQSLEATCSFLSFISRDLATRRHRTTQYKTHSNRTPTDRSTGLVYDVTGVRTHMHIAKRSPQNSMVIKRMHKQCIPGALSPPHPLYLRTRLTSPYGTLTVFSIFILNNYGLKFSVKFCTFRYMYNRFSDVKL